MKINEIHNLLNRAVWSAELTEHLDGMTFDVFLKAIHRPGSGQNVYELIWKKTGHGLDTCWVLNAIVLAGKRCYKHLVPLIKTQPRKFIVGSKRKAIKSLCDNILSVNGIDTSDH